MRFVQDEVFAFFEEIADPLGDQFHARRAPPISREPTVLTQVVTLVDGLKLDPAKDSDTKGDLFEYVLKQIKQAGELGQFRTPRHIIRAIVEMIDPKIGETVYDPAAGTAGFLVAAYNHIRLANSSPAGIHRADIDGKVSGAASATNFRRRRPRRCSPRRSSGMMSIRKWYGLPR